MPQPLVLLVGLHRQHGTHTRHQIEDQAAHQGEAAIGNIFRENDFIKECPFGIESRQLFNLHTIRLSSSFCPGAFPDFTVSNNGVRVDRIDPNMVFSQFRCIQVRKVNYCLTNLPHLNIQDF